MARAKPSSEIRLTRIYDAPVALVWEAWTDPTHVAKWWGPRGFTLTTHSKDFRAGGHWRYTMHGPDGTDYPNHTVYHEIETHRRMVYDHGGFDDRPPLFRVTVIFTDLEGKTRMDISFSLPTPEAAEETRKFIKKAGGESTWDRLGEYLAKETSGKERFLINRAFDVPIAKMYEMWINPDHVARWTPPKGFTMKFIRADIRPGGGSFYAMTNGTVTMHGRVSYLEFERPTRVVYTQQFCDENETLSRHPMSPTWPETMLTTVTLAEEGPDRTRVTIQWEPCGNLTPEEIATFVAARAGMTAGWTGSLDKLEEYLSN